MAIELKKKILAKPSEGGFLIITLYPTAQMEKLRHREIKGPVRGHT